MVDTVNSLGSDESVVIQQPSFETEQQQQVPAGEIAQTPAEEPIGLNDNVQQSAQETPDVKDSDPAGYQKRINKIFREKKIAEQRAAQLEAQNNFYQQQLRTNGYSGTQQVQPEPQSYGVREPDVNDPKYQQNPLQFTKDYAAYVQQSMAYKSQHEQQTRYLQDLNQQHQIRVVEAKARYEDFDEVLDNLSTLEINSNHPTLQQLTIAIQEMPNSADMAYYFGKNPQELLRLCGLPSMNAAVELGKIASRVTQPKVINRNGQAPFQKAQGDTGAQPRKVTETQVIGDIAGRLRKMG